MKITNLTEGSMVYTSNVYLVTGTWNTLSDVNTLIDVGRDLSIIEKINEFSTGVGKKKIDQVILTHNHYDHAGILQVIKETFNPEILAYSNTIAFIDRLVKDGDLLKIGEHEFEVFHTPGHSGDSICLFDPVEGILFAGDTPLIINTPDTTHDEAFIEVLVKLSKLDIKTIYFGHGKALSSNCNATILRSLSNVKYK